jgi:hypothetical protein
LIGYGFLLGVIFGILSTVILQLYLAYKLFNYEDYMRTSKEIEDNRLFWKERMAGYQELIRKEISELGPYNNSMKDYKKDIFILNSSISFSEEDDPNEKEDIKSLKQLMKEKVIQKSLYELNDKNSNIMLSSGMAPSKIFKKETLKVLNRGKNENEDDNFEVQFRARFNASERYAKIFIDYYNSVSETEYNIKFKKILDQKARYSLTRRKTFNIFKKGSKWLQIRYAYFS